MYKILIVEDDPVIQMDLEDLLHEKGYSVCGSFFSAEEAYSFLTGSKADIVLLDIKLKGKMSGIELGQKINNEFSIPFIYITSYSDTTTVDEVLLTKPAAYLVKNFNPAALIAAIEIAMQNSVREPQKKTGNEILIKESGMNLKISIDEILFAEASDNYTYLQTKTKRHLVTQTLKQVETKLSGHSFVRVHRSFLINTRYVKGMKDDFIILEEHKIPVGRTHKAVLKELFFRL